MWYRIQKAQIPKDLLLVFPEELFSFAEEKHKNTGEQLISGGGNYQGPHYITLS